MRSLARLSMMALLALGAALPVQGYIGFILGNPASGVEFAPCDAAQLVEPTAGNLYMAREGNPNDILAIMDNGVTLFGCNGWSGGFYDCPGANFKPEPTTATESVYVVVTGYPSGETDQTHRGWVLVDVTQGTTADFGANVGQALWPLTVGPYVAQGGASGTNSGFDYRFRGIVEFGRDQSGSITCRIGGDAAGTAFDDRPIAGYNIYRLCGATAATTTPRHYLCGPDLNCSTTADNGFVAFVPSGTGSGGTGLNLSTPAAAAATSDNNVADAYGVQGGPNGTGAEQDAVLIFSDNVGISPKPLANPQAACDYVFQPVIKGNASEDADADTIPDLDLDNDGTPEFISPQGATNGLGLTADLGGNRVILISGDLQATGSAATPAGDALQFQGIYNGKTQAFDINFISSLETGLAGYNLFRSTLSNDPSSYTKVNGAMIPAKGASLSSYVYSDPFRAQARKGNLTYYYKVEAVRTDGTSKLYGPYQVTYTGATEQRRDRGMR